MNRKDFIKSLILAPVTAKVLMDGKELPDGIKRYIPNIFEYPMTPEEAFKPILDSREQGIKRFQLKLRATQSSRAWRLIDTIYLKPDIT